MSWRLSTGMRNAILESGSVKTTLENGQIRIFSGSQPSSADDGEQGTHLCTITVDGAEMSSGDSANGLNLGSAEDGKINKSSDETWKGENLEDGTAGWFRWYPNDYSDHQGEDSDGSKIRIDGRCGSSVGEMRLSNTSLTKGADTTIDSVELTMPAS